MVRAGDYPKALLAPISPVVTLTLRFVLRYRQPASVRTGDRGGNWPLGAVVSAEGSQVTGTEAGGELQEEFGLCIFDGQVFHTGWTGKTGVGLLL